jgi:hypothetical protein
VGVLGVKAHKSRNVIGSGRFREKKIKDDAIFL